MVCMGNVCRSPMAQSITLHLARAAELKGGCDVDSAGTHAGHIGEAPDPRAKAALTSHGYPVGKTRSRRVTDRDFARYDLILAMDQANLNDLRELCPNEHAHKLRLLLEFAPDAGVLEVPDPYYGGVQGFERVLELCEAGARGLVAYLETRPAQTL